MLLGHKDLILAEPVPVNPPELVFTVDAAGIIQHVVTARPGSGLPDPREGLALAQILGTAAHAAHYAGMLRRSLAGEALSSEVLVGTADGPHSRLSITFIPASSARVAVSIRSLPLPVLMDEERHATLALMAALRTDVSLRELTHNVVSVVRHFTGCEAIGIRLAHGEDYPYFETHGFPAQFVEMERTLCARGCSGEMLRDAQGRPILECMCGNILRGRFNPAAPFFTAHGSFWSNGTTKLLRTTTDAGRQARTRNRCNGEGYESVALMPLRASGVTYGLLQVNDRRPDRFTPQTITLLEHLADALALALAQRAAEQALRGALEEKGLLLREVHHRVKNNLQLIVSMLRSNARCLADPQARAFAEDNVARISAMAMVHEQLYAAADLGRIDVGAYTRGLAEQAFRGERGERPELRLVCECAAVEAELDRAIPVGLVVHELVVNALRHAFQDHRAGEVRVNLSTDATGALLLRVQDTGVGIPEPAERAVKGRFGLSLVELLARQHRGSVRLERDAGTCVSVCFPRPAEVV